MRINPKAAVLEPDSIILVPIPQLRQTDLATMIALLGCMGWALLTVYSGLNSSDGCNLNNPSNSTSCTAVAPRKPTAEQWGIESAVNKPDRYVIMTRENRDTVQISQIDSIRNDSRVGSSRL